MFYVAKDDIIYPVGYDSLDAARSAAEDMKNDQRAFLMAKKRIAKLFGKGVPLNLSTYRIITISEVYYDSCKKKTRFDEYDKLTPCGKPTTSQYSVYVDENGVRSIKYVGETPLQDLIESYADSCTIDSVVRRAGLGDASALNARAGSFLDLSSMPRNAIEAYEYSKKIQSYYDALPVEIKDRHADLASFVSSVDDGSFLKEFGEKLGLVKKEVKSDG